MLKQAAIPVVARFEKRTNLDPSTKNPRKREPHPLSPHRSIRDRSIARRGSPLFETRKACHRSRDLNSARESLPHPAIWTGDGVGGPRLQPGRLGVQGAAPPGSTWATGCASSPARRKLPPTAPVPTHRLGRVNGTGTPCAEGAPRQLLESAPKHGPFQVTPAGRNIGRGDPERRRAGFRAKGPVRSMGHPAQV